MTSCTCGLARYGARLTGFVPGGIGKSASMMLHFPNSSELKENTDLYLVHSLSTSSHWSGEKVVDWKALVSAFFSS